MWILDFAEFNILDAFDLCKLNVIQNSPGTNRKIIQKVSTTNKEIVTCQRHQVRPLHVKSVMPVELDFDSSHFFIQKVFVYTTVRVAYQQALLTSQNQMHRLFWGLVWQVKSEKSFDLIDYLNQQKIGKIRVDFEDVLFVVNTHRVLWTCFEACRWLVNLGDFGLIFRIENIKRVEDLDTRYWSRFLVWV